jgi:hypothetical protein
MATSAALRNCPRRAIFSVTSDIRFPPKLRDLIYRQSKGELTARTSVKEAFWFFRPSNTKIRRNPSLAGLVREQPKVDQ